MKTFREKVLDYVNKIPKGKVVSYGQVAAACGHPRAARQVGQILRNLDISVTFKKSSRVIIHSEQAKHWKGKPLVGFPSEDLPWWRVVNSKGEISIKGNWTADKETQRDLLIRDGVSVSKDLKVELKMYSLYYGNK